MSTGYSEPNLYDSMAIYRSSDENVLGGVFAGLAHKWGLNKNGLRIAIVVFILFFDVWLTLWIGTVGIFICYILLCLILPKRPTSLSPEQIASNAIKSAYEKGDLHLAIHFAEKFLHNNPASRKKEDFNKIIDELRKKVR